MSQTGKASHWPLTILGSASSLFNLFLPVVMSRRLPPSAVGEYKVFFLYLAAVPALSLGIGFTNGTYLWGADQVEGRSKARAAFMLALSSGLFATLVVLLSSAYFGISSALLLFAIACPPAVASSMLEARLVAEGRVREAAFFSAGFEFLRLALVMSTVMLGFGITVVLAVHAIGQWAKLLAAGYAMGLESPLKLKLRRWTPELLNYALPVSIAAVFDLLILNADRYVLSALLLPADFAIYAFGCLMVPPLFVFEQSVNQVLIPRLALLRSQPKEAANLFRMSVEDLLILLVPASAGLIAIADPLVRLLFTDVYREAARFLAWYALYYALSGVPQDVLARAWGDSRWIMRVSIFFGVMALALAGLAAFFSGALAALQAFLFTQALRRLWAIRYLRRNLGAELPEVFPVRSALIFISAALLATWAGRQASSFGQSSLSAVLYGGTAFTAIYFAIVLRFERPTLARLFLARRKA